MNKKKVVKISILPQSAEVDLESVRGKIVGFKKEGLVWGEGRVENRRLMIEASVDSKFNLNEVLEELQVGFQDLIQKIVPE